MTLPRKTANTPADAMVELIGESFQLNGHLQRAADRMARDAGLTGTRWQVLSAIAKATRPATISDIARWMGLARQSVQQVANALAEEGLIAYRPNPKHQRASLVVVTEKAAKPLAQLDRQRLVWARAIATTLPAADIRMASEVLRSVRDTLRD